jgi:phosphoglycolate phosphatase-like HAD superfamily hydrolase
MSEPSGRESCAARARTQESPQAAPEWVLVLFDVDGTLVDLAGAGRRAMERAFEESWGFDRALDGVRMGGRTDRAIVTAVLAARQRRPPGLAADIEHLFDEYLRLLPREVARTPYSATPGARELLEVLACEPRVKVGLATGNIERAAELKLSSAGIRGPFPFGAFGGAYDSRPALVRAAIAAGERLLPEGATYDTWVVGDTPHDVEAARATGVRALAVAQGPVSLAELAATGADLVVTDLAAALEARFWVARQRAP